MTGNEGPARERQLLVDGTSCRIWGAVRKAGDRPTRLGFYVGPGERLHEVVVNDMGDGRIVAVLSKVREEDDRIWVAVREKGPRGHKMTHMGRWMTKDNYMLGRNLISFYAERTEVIGGVVVEAAAARELPQARELHAEKEEGPRGPSSQHGAACGRLHHVAQQQDAINHPTNPKRSPSASATLGGDSLGAAPSRRCVAAQQS